LVVLTKVGDLVMTPVLVGAGVRRMVGARVGDLVVLVGRGVRRMVGARVGDLVTVFLNLITEESGL
jgi:hypothetical protein